jgi:hypothetical protein
MTRDRETLERRRVALEALIGWTLPSSRSEAASPDKADQQYVAATRQLISLIRQRADRFPRVQDENIGYGFIRNLLGLRYIGLASVILAAAIVGFSHSSVGAVPTVAVEGILMILLTAWIFYVTPDRVREAANIYAERLFECLDTPEVISGP